MDKRGISAIVATVLIILITVASVTILWIAVIPMIKENVEFSGLEGRVSIVSSKGYTVYDSEKQIASIQVKRDVGEDSMGQMRIIFNFGGDDYSSTVSAPDSGGMKVYNFDLSDYGEPESVSVAPIFLGENKEIEGEVTSKVQISLGTISNLNGRLFEIGGDYSSRVRSCLDILENGKSVGDGIYTIDPLDEGGFEVYCDMTTDGGGWTIVMAHAAVKNQPGLTSDVELMGDAIAYKGYNLNLEKKEVISAISSESLIKRSAGPWIKIDHVLFDDNLVGSGNQHPHWQVTVTSSNGVVATNCQMGYSNYNKGSGGDYGITTSGKVFDHHSPNYYHLNSGCANMYFYQYGSTYNVNSALGSWVVTQGCASSGTQMGSWYAGMR